MKVRATRLGYYDHERRHVGSIFEMRDEDYAPKDKEGKPLVYPQSAPEDLRGKPKVCTWVEPFDEHEEKEPVRKRGVKSMESREVI